MSHSFYVRQAPKLNFAKMVEEVGQADLKIVEDVAELPDGAWPVGIMHLYVDGKSTRSLEVGYEGDAFDLRIMTATDHDTIALGGRIVAAVARQVGGTIESEDKDGKMSPETFEAQFGQDWVREHTRFGFEAVRKGVERGSGTLTLSGARREVHLGDKVRPQLPTEHDAFAADLTERIRMLNYPDHHDTYLPSVMVMTSQDGQRTVRMTSYAAIQSLLSADADVVALKLGDDVVDIPTDRLVEVLGARGRWLDDRTYLAPELTAADIDALRPALDAARADDPLTHGRSAEEQRQWESSGGYTTTAPPIAELMLQALAPVPAVVFMVVAGADGEFEAKEMKAFQAHLQDLARANNEFINGLIVAGLQAFEPACMAVGAGQLQPAEVLVDAANVLERALPPELAETVKQIYLTLGMRIAQANAKGFFSKKVRTEEEAALAFLIQHLRPTSGAN